MQYLVVLALLTPHALLAQAETVFKGRPAVQITAAGEERSVKQLSRADAETYLSVISRIGDNYYWASRENTRLIRIDGPAYTMFLAPNGSGYVKIVQSERRKDASLFDSAAEKYDYVEHILLGLGSISYYAKRQ